MLRKLLWTEGLFITQHHLQQLDRYHEQLLTERFRALSPYAWGVTELEFEERSLSAGEVRVSRLSLVLPDGTPIHCSEGRGDVIPPRSIHTEFAPHMSELDIYLAISHETDGAANVEMQPHGPGYVRYSKAEASVRDLNTGAEEQPIDWARPNLRLLVGDEPRATFQTVRLGQLIRTSAGALAFRPSCVPPILRVGASPFLLSGLRNLLSAMNTRQRSLADSRRQRSASSIEFDASDVAKLWLLHTLNGTIPVFTHLVDDGTAHPEHAYRLLVQLAGSLCTFSPHVEPAALPKFNYLDLGTSFEPLFKLTRELIEAAISERYLEIPLERRPDGVHLGKVRALEWMRGDFFLAITTTLPEEQVRDRLPKLTKIASPEKIGALLNSAMNGAQLQLEFRPPASLPIKPGTIFFKINRTPQFWPDIAATGNFAIYHPFDVLSVRMALYATGTDMSP